MNSICPEIDYAIKLAIEAGNSIKEKSEGWSKAKQVIAMKSRLDENLKENIEQNIKKLKYWRYEGSPHNEPDEGFTCDECKVVLSFPLPRKVVR